MPSRDLNAVKGKTGENAAIDMLEKALKTNAGDIIGFYQEDGRVFVKKME